MAGACCKCPASLSVFRRSLSVAPRGCGSAPRFPFLLQQGWRVGERGGLQEAARPCNALRPMGFYRQTAFLCLSCQESMTESLRTCYVYLNQTSRSFAAVIQALDGELRWVSEWGGGGVSAGMFSLGVDTTTRRRWLHRKKCFQKKSTNMPRSVHLLHFLSEQLQKVNAKSCQDSSSFNKMCKRLITTYQVCVLLTAFSPVFY